MDRINTRSRRNSKESNESQERTSETADTIGQTGNGKNPIDAAVSKMEASIARSTEAKSADASQQEPLRALRGDEQIARVAPQKLQETFLDERDDVLSVINELEDQLDRYQEIREALERDLKEATAQLQSANRRVQELEWQVVAFQTRTDALEQVRQEVSQLEEEVGDANGRIQRLEEQLNRSEKENLRLRNELKAANKQLEDLWATRKERDGLRTDVRDLRAKMDELERAQRDALEERGQLLSKLQETQAALEGTIASRHQLQISVRNADDRAQQMLRVQEALTDKLDAIRDEKKSLQAQITHLERENARLSEQRQYYECEMTSLRNVNRDAESALTSVKKAFAEVRVALSETKTRARRRSNTSWPRIGSTMRESSTSFDDLADENADEEIPTLADEQDSPIAAAAHTTSSAFSTNIDEDIE
ncbi:MAG: hypothetical protein KKB50_12455 [Planctomycetes bacterium]|nr:hypothetical protein [Planctomycetota bacterium]